MNIQFSKEALNELCEYALTIDDIKTALEKHNVLTVYYETKPSPSYLIKAWKDTFSFYLVYTLDNHQNTVITRIYS